MRATLLMLALLCALPLAAAEQQENLHVLIERACYMPGERISILLTGARYNGTLVLRVRGEEGVVSSVTVPPSPGTSVVELTAPSREGLYYVELIASAPHAAPLVLAREPLPVLNCSGRKVMLAMVWHCHQGINAMPTGEFHGDWAFQYVYSPLSPYYSYGVYRLHAELARRYSVNVTINLSPSLLWQWMYAIKFGYRYSGRYILPNSTQVEAVRDALQAFRELAESGVVEPLTSYFNHPIPGYVADRYGWGASLMEEELKWGVYVTVSALGVRPRGAWVPEMFFSMRLIEGLQRQGISYVVLDARYHLSRAVGEVGTPYQPYAIRSGNRSIVAFFRDSDLSDYVSFGLELRDELDARVAARRFLAQVVERLLKDPEAGVVVVAADGENWILQNPLRALFLEELYRLVAESCCVRAVTLSQALEALEPRRVLTHVPTNSWAGGDWVWTQRSENALQWALVEKSVECLLRIGERCGTDTPLYRAALFAVFMALNSDVIHREYTMLAHTEAWARKVEMICRRGVSEAAELHSLGFNLEQQRRSIGEAECIACPPSILDLLPQALLILALASATIAWALLRRSRRPPR